MKVDPERPQTVEAVAAISASLAGGGPMSSEELTERFETLDDAAQYVAICSVQSAGPSMTLGAEEQWEGDSGYACSRPQCMDQVEPLGHGTTSAEVMRRCSAEQQSAVSAQSASVPVPVPTCDVSLISWPFDVSSPLSSPSLHTPSGISGDVSPTGKERVRVKEKEKSGNAHLTPVKSTENCLLQELAIAQTGAEEEVARLAGW